MAVDLGPFAELDYCYLTTKGRRSGQPHEIEIWFAIEGQTLYLLSGGGDGSDWVKNLRRTPEVSLRLGESSFEGRAGVVEDADEDELARRLLFEKYQAGYSGDLEDWRGRALPVAIDLT
ncbi:MAG: nitroreductase family deazaflavin-dependent oxidoreductase [Dehalococcoidia bacterium]